MTAVGNVTTISESCGSSFILRSNGDKQVISTTSELRETFKMQLNDFTKQEVIVITNYVCCLQYPKHDEKTLTTSLFNQESPGKDRRQHSYRTYLLRKKKTLDAFCRLIAVS